MDKECRCYVYKGSSFSKPIVYLSQNHGLEEKTSKFSTSLSHSKQFLFNSRTRDVTRSQSFNITSLSVGLAKD